VRRNRKAGVGCGVFKNAAILFTVILLGIGCAGGNNQDERKLIGQWVSVDDEDSKFVFNSDGTMIDDEGDTSKYWVATGKIICDVYDNELNDYHISSDGKTLILGNYLSGRVIVLQRK
jgi:hypothetical protein